MSQHPIVGVWGWGGVEDFRIVNVLLDMRGDGTFLIWTHRRGVFERGTWEIAADELRMEAEGGASVIYRFRLEREDLIVSGGNLDWPIRSRRRTDLAFSGENPVPIDMPESSLPRPPAPPDLPGATPLDR